MQDDTEARTTRVHISEHRLDPADLWWRIAAGKQARQQLMFQKPRQSAWRRFRNSRLFGIACGFLLFAVAIALPLLALRAL